MNRSQRLKLAKAARELASLYVEGRGPELNPWSFCGCAAAEVVRRAGYDEQHVSRVAMSIDADRGYLLSEATRELYGHGKYYGRPTHGAVVFPLLWLADELESQP